MMNLTEKLDFLPLYHSALPLLVIWLLRLIGEAKIMPCIFIQNSAIHVGFTIPIKFEKFIEELLLIALAMSEEAIDS